MSALFPAAPDAFGADELLRLRREISRQIYS